MADLESSKFRVDASMELAADEFSADQNDSTTFRTTSGDDTIKLRAGLKNRVTQVATTVGALEGSVVEYRLSLSNNGLRASVMGRDNIASMLNRRFKKLFLRTQPEAGKEPTGSYAVGSFLASEIASEVVEYCGLSLVWGCRDYTLLEDFEANGRPIDILKKLVEPWSQVEPFKVDIFCQGSVIFCRPRLINMTADYQCNVKDARVDQLSIAKRRGPYYGLVRLSGREVPKKSGFGLQPGEEEEETPPGQPVQSWEFEDVKLVEAKDEAGEVQTRNQVTTTYRMPDKIVLKIVELTYNRDKGQPLQLVSKKETFNEWESSSYDVSGRTNNPRNTKQTILTSGIHKDDKTKTFQALQKEETTYGRDELGYISLTSTFKWELNLKRRQLLPSEKVIKTIAELERLKQEQVTSIFKPKKKQSGTGTDWYLERFESQISAGFKADGPAAPPEPKKKEDPTAGAASGPMEQIVLEETISVDPTAEDIEYSNRSMTEEDLQFIMAQFRAASGMIRFQISMSYVAMPWLRKGSILKLNNLLAEDGVTSITLQPALITDMGLNYSEEGSPELVSDLTAEYWASSWSN